MEAVKNDGKLRLGSENDRLSVDFLPNTVDKTIAFTSLLMKEMYLRGKSTMWKTLNQIQAELKDCLIAEKDMDDLLKVISEASTRKEAMAQIMLFVPCIMHCENCIGIKIMTMLFIQGLLNYQGARFTDLETTRSQKTEKRGVH